MENQTAKIERIGEYLKSPLFMAESDYVGWSSLEMKQILHDIMLIKLKGGKI